MVDVEKYGWDDTPTPDMGLDESKAPQVIQKLAQYVIDKRKGKDVASAYSQSLIASGILALEANTLSKEIEVFLADMIQELTGKELISGPEVVQARGGRDTLAQRLDETAMLDEVFLKANGINVNDFDEPTRQAFLEAQGIDVNYVLGPGNVKPINMSIVRVAGNIFNPNNVTAGKLINSSGILANSEAYNASDFIQVMVGRSHTFRNIRNFAKYDSEGNFIEFVDLVAGANVSTHVMNQPLIRTSVHENFLSSARIEEGEDTSDGGPMRNIIPSDFIEKENYPAFVRYKDGAVPYITDRIYSAIRSISLQGFEIDKTYKLRYISRNDSTNAYRFIVAELNEDGTWSDYFDSWRISVSENSGRLTTVVANDKVDNSKTVIMKVDYDLIPNNYADNFEGNHWVTVDPYCVINSSGMGGGGGDSSFNQSLNTTDSPTFEEVITTGVLPTGTLSNPPSGLITGDTWADTTDSATHPILRVKL